MCVHTHTHTHTPTHTFCLSLSPHKSPLNMRCLLVCMCVYMCMCVCVCVCVCVHRWLFSSSVNHRRWLPHLYPYLILETHSGSSHHALAQMPSTPVPAHIPSAHAPAHLQAAPTLSDTKAENSRAAGMSAHQEPGYVSHAAPSRDQVSKLCCEHYTLEGDIDREEAQRCVHVQAAVHTCTHMHTQSLVPSLGSVMPPPSTHTHAHTHTHTEEDFGLCPWPPPSSG